MPSRSIKRLRTKRKLGSDYPILLVSRSNKNVSAQVLQPDTGKTLCSVNSNNLTGMTKTDKSTKVGKLLAEKLKSLNISKVVFHRNGYLYHGRVAAVADAVRQENIEI